MKIAMIGQKGLPARYGGVERHVHDLSLGLVLAGYDVTVYSRRWYTNGKDGVYRGVRVVHTPSLQTKYLDTITHVFASTLDALLCDYDVLHYHGVGPALLSWLPRLVRRSVRVVTTFHSIDRYDTKWGPISRLVLRLGEWAACRFAHETITISRSLEQYCRHEFQSETVYIPNGVAAPVSADNSGLLSVFGLRPRQYLLMVARLIPNKGAHLLLEAFQKLKKQHPDDPEIRSLKLAIVGGSVYTGDYVRELHRVAARSSEIVFTDFQSGPALFSLYAGALALVHPSLSEGLPMVVLEAMSQRIPVLVSNIPEHLELVRDPRCIFAENDVDALYQSLYNFLQLSSQDRTEMIATHHRQVETEYSWQVLLPQIESVYRHGERHGLPSPQPIG